MSTAPISAQRARLIASQNLRGPVIQPLLDHVYQRIHEAASKGQTSIVHPLDGLRTVISQEQRDAVWDALRAQGYKVTHHPDPDPGHPASRLYDSVSWA